MSHTQYEALIARLEKAVGQIEGFASKVGANISNAVHNVTHSSSAHSEAAASPAYTAWQDLEANQLKAFVDAANRVSETKSLGAAAQTAFHRVGELVAASSQSKKPADADLMAFLAPVIGVIEKTANADNRSPYFNHQKAFSEGITSVNWVTIAPPNGLPKEIAQSGVEQADFYLIKILSEAKKKTGKEADDATAFANSYKQLLQKQTQFVAEFFRTGLEWNVKGQPLSQWSASGSAASGSVPPPPGAPEAPSAPSFTTQASNAASKAASSVAGGMGAVFGQLSNLGDSVTTGLKKVTSDMKTKNRPKDEQFEALVPKATTAPAAKPATTATKPKREARTHQNKGTWFVEYYDGGEVSVDQVELKESVYILGCTNTTVRVPVKCKSIQVDSCKKVTVECQSVVSTFELVNSERIHVYINDNVPSIAIDKTDGASIHLVTKAVAERPPQIVTSKVSELNLVVPGATDDDDPIEMPLPEQFITVFEGGKLKTESVAHSAN